MRGDLRVLASPELANGFALAGLTTVEARSAEEGAELARQLAHDPDVAILLVEQSFLNALSEAASTEIWRRPSPIIVPFPRPEWVERPAEPEAYILELLRRAIGYRVRLQ